MKHKLAITGFILYTCFLIASVLNSTISFIIFTVVSGTALILLLRRKSRSGFCLVVIGASFLIYGIYSLLVIEPCYKLYGNVYEVTGTVISRNLPSNDTVGLTVETEIDGTPVRFGVFAPDTDIKAGDTAKFTVKFSPLTDNLKFSERTYNYSRGIFVKATALSEPIKLSDGGFSFSGAITSYASHLKDSVRNILGDDGALITAIFFGDKSGLTDSLSADIRKTGLSHITAVSGMHLSLIIITLLSLIDLTAVKRFPKLKFLIIIISTAVFAVFFELTASVVRSAIMLVIYYGHQPFLRKSSIPDSLGAAVTLILLSDPCGCRDIGLMLSALATVGAGYLAPRLSALLIKKNSFRALKESIIVSLCASFCVIPVSALCFGGFSVISILATTVIYPFFYIAVCSMLIFALTGGLFGSVLLIPAGFAGKCMTAVISLLSDIPYCYVSLNGSFVIPFLSVALIFGAVLYIVCKKPIYTVRFAVVCVAVIFGMNATDKLISANDTVIRVCSDGNAAIVTVSDSYGTSAFASDDNGTLNSYLSDILTDNNESGLNLLILMCDEKDFSGKLTSNDIMQTHGKSDGEAIYDVCGEYTAAIRSGSVILDINGVSVALTEPDNNIYADIVINSGYKKDDGVYGGTLTVFSDKRYHDKNDCLNAYYDYIEIHINKNGLIRLGEEAIY